MIDLASFPAGADVQVFSSANPGTAIIGNVWTKPRGANFVFMYLIGGGGGGGGGFAAATGSTKGGGGGGHGGGLSQAMFLAAVLPDRLYVAPGRAGVGGTSGNPSTAGLQSSVYVHLGAAVARNTVLTAMGGGVAGAGTGAAGGAGATATSNVAGNCPLVYRSAWMSFVTGRTGTNGGTSTAPSAVTVGTGLPILGGGGGGGYTAAGSPSAGAAISFGGYIPNHLGGTATGATAGAGTHGKWYPPYIFGGAGGGGTNDAASTGGRGGDGVAPGAGGGGGGAGVTGGRGGDGGPGLVVIVSW